MTDTLTAADAQSAGRGGDLDGQTVVVIGGTAGIGLGPRGWHATTGRGSSSPPGTRSGSNR